MEAIGEGAVGLGPSARNAMHVVEVADAGEEGEADGNSIDKSHTVLMAAASRCSYNTVPIAASSRKSDTVPMALWRGRASFQAFRLQR